MNKTMTKIRNSILFLALSMAMQVSAQDLKPIALPKPQTTIGRPFMQVLQERKTIREFSTEKVPLQQLANLLWAGFGINRATNSHRTAPSAMNSQEIDIYVASAEGVYVYDAAGHQLKPVLAQDIRLKTGSGAFMKDAPLSLVFVADYSRLTKSKAEEKPFYAAIDTGFISENIYLYCASEGLGTVIHMAGDTAGLAKAMQLKPEQKIVIAQAVGFPKK